MRDGVVKIRVRDELIKIRVRDGHIIPCPSFAGCEKKKLFYALLCNEKFQSTVDVSCLLSL